MYQFKIDFHVNFDQNPSMTKIDIECNQTENDF